MKLTQPDRKTLIRLTVSGSLILLVSTGAGYVYAYSGRMAPRTRIGGVSVGHLTKSAAQALVIRHENDFLAKNLMLEYPGGSLNVQPKLLGLKFETQASLDAAYANVNSASLITRIQQLIVAPFHSTEYPLGLDPVNDEGSVYISKHLASDLEKPVTETTLSFIPGNVTVKPGIAGQLVDIAALSSTLSAAYDSQADKLPLTFKMFKPAVTADGAAAALAEAQMLLATPWSIQAGSRALTLSDQDLAALLATKTVPAINGTSATLALTLQPEPLKAYVMSLAALVDRPASNAMLGAVNGSVAVTQSDVDGLSLDQAAAAAAFQVAEDTPPADRVVTISTAVTKAAIRADTLVSSGVSQLIGTATTDFAGSPVNRVYNITVGQKSLNGILIADGKEFSTLDGLGPIDGAHGYKPELSIVNNRTVAEDGGGLCQVSTTLFRSALNAGLPIPERYNHAYRVGYYELGTGPGLDATIYSPAPDFKWKNDTGHPVYVESHIAGTKITFELYGTSDGRTAQISPTTIVSETPPGDAIYSNTDTLPKGTTKQIEHPHSGAVTSVTYTVMRAGQPINTQTFKSTYRPWPSQFLVGTS